MIYDIVEEPRSFGMGALFGIVAVLAITLAGLWLGDARLVFEPVSP